MATIVDEKSLLKMVREICDISLKVLRFSDMFYIMCTLEYVLHDIY